MTKFAPADLAVILDGYREPYPKLSDDERVMVWFLRAFVTDTDAALSFGPQTRAGGQN